MRIAVSGASGLIGSALVPALRAHGHEVLRLVRTATRSTDEIEWDPAGRRLAPPALAGVDAVVHLAGAGIADRPWTGRRKQVIRDSRVDGTATIAEGVAAARVPVLLSGSAIGWYGDTGDRAVDESAPPGEGFLAEIARDWEAATRAAELAGARVVHLRTGIVLSRSGGALGRVLPLFRAGLGARLGTGDQWTSFISRPDEVAAITFLLTADLEGPVNLTAPHPVTNADYTRAVARALGRPAPLAVPAALLRQALGGLAREGLLASQRVLPARLLGAGFAFAHPDIDTALCAVLGD